LPPGKAGVVGRNEAAKTGQKTEAAAGFCPAPLGRSFLQDQKNIWTSPFRLHASDISWLAPVGLGTFGFMASDNPIMRHLTTPIAHSSGFSNY
jgi:hypothetical protein